MVRAANTASFLAIKTKYDIAIVGSGHNGLVAACYLAKAGLSVLVLEKNHDVGGATRSAALFPGLDAKVSMYSYLVSLFPEKIVDELGLKLRLLPRKVSSWTPSIQGGKLRELLIHNGNPDANRTAFAKLTGGDRDFEGYLKLQEMQQSLASVVWPSLTVPMVSRSTMSTSVRAQADGDNAWRALIEEPVGKTIEALISDDLIRGIVFTDAKIGVSTCPEDPSLLQNRCFLYHVIGRLTGEWNVPAGGMGSLVAELQRVAAATGKVEILTGADVRCIDSAGEGGPDVEFELGGRSYDISTRYVLCNASAEVLASLLGRPSSCVSSVEGAGFKINMLLKKLPRLLSDKITAEDAFAGTAHIDEGYEHMRECYHGTMSGELPARPPGEVYCHTLTDNSILSDELNMRGYHTLTLFGLDAPYRLYEPNNEQLRGKTLERYLGGINRYLEEPIQDCLALDKNGKPCIEAMSPVDLEKKLHLPKGNIFHGDLAWPFAESRDEVGRWGVETELSNVFICGSAAKRGGAVSGIPGHNAAMKVFEMEGIR